MAEWTDSSSLSPTSTEKLDYNHCSIRMGGGGGRFPHFFCFGMLVWGAVVSVSDYTYVHIALYSIVVHYFLWNLASYGILAPLTQTSILTAYVVRLDSNYKANFYHFSCLEKYETAKPSSSFLALTWLWHTPVCNAISGWLTGLDIVLKARRWLANGRISLTHWRRRYVFCSSNLRRNRLCVYVVVHFASDRRSIVTRHNLQHRKYCTWPLLKLRKSSSGGWYKSTW